MRWGATPPAPKRKRDWRDALIEGSIGLPAMGLERTPWGFTQGLGHVIGALGTSPLQALLFPKETVRGAQSALTGLWEGPYGFGKTVRQEGFGDAASLFLESMKQDYKDRYGSNWKEHARDNGLFNLFDALAFIGAGARGASLIGAGSRLGAAGERMTMRNLWKESSRPGLISEGEAFTREIGFQPSVGPEMRATQPYSRSPTRRATQDLADALAERFPNTPLFGARSRVTRAQGSQMRRVIERTLGGIVGEEALNGLSTAGRSRLFWEAQLGTSDDGTLIRLRNALKDEFDADPDVADPDFAQWLREAKQAGFGDQLIRRLDDAIDFDPATSKGRYERAKDALRQATELSERTIADSEGFGSLQQDLKRVSDRIDGLESGSEEWKLAVQERVRLRREIAEKAADLETMFRNRRSIVRDWLDTKGENEFADAWAEVLPGLIGQDQADHAIAVAHAIANKIRPDDPESWWADKVGMPSQESAALFRERVGSDALFQFGHGEGLLDSGFYSPTQKWALDAPEWGRKGQMTPRQLETLIRKNAGDEEFYNAGLDVWLNSLPDGEMIQKQEFLNLLANRLNAYNFRQVVRRNTPESFEETGLEALYDEKFEGVYISRDPARGEYYEVQFELPGPGRDKAFRDKNNHWDRDNVVAHFRFHVFEEDGVRKLLVEEIQSDWASEYREQRKAGREYRDLKPHEADAFDALRAEIEEKADRLRQLRQRQQELDSEIRSDNPDPDAEAEWYGNQDEIDRLNQDWWELNQGFDYYNDEFGLGAVPPSPLGTGTGAKSSYINSPIRWIGRFAVENDVDEVVLISREAQLARNAKAVAPHMWHALKDEGAEAITQHIRDTMPRHRSFIGYAEDIPRRMSEEWGVAGEFVDDAYEGTYRVPSNPTDDAWGRMPGTVFKVDDVFRENAMKPKSMYQRTPDWNALPKGAVELFAGGKSRIHIFEGGDVSTWIHELGHVALGDLGPEDLKVIEGHYGGGKPLAEWTEMQHEDFARGFESYVREGRAPTRALEPIFAKLSSWIRAVWEREKRVNKDLPPEVRDVFSQLFKSADEPDIFIPHRPGSPDLAGGRTSRGIPRANREIGDRAISRIPLFKKNTLALMRGGLLNDDPRMLMEHANRVVALARANQLREAVLNMGEPLLPGDYPDFDTQYVVKRAGRGVDKPAFDALESADNPQEIRDTIRDYIDDHITDEAQKYEAWKGESQLYVVDKKQVDMLFKYVTGKTPGAATKPVTNTMKVVDALLDSFRGLLLYANPGFYVTNMLGNTGMMMLKDPAAVRYLPWSMKQAATAAKRPEAADPLWQRISVEMGRGPTSGAFSIQATRDILTGRPGEEGNIFGRAGETVSAGLGEWGRRSGRVIDDSFRVSAWRQSAAKRGYRTDAQVQSLFDDASVKRPFRGKVLEQKSKAEKELASIRDEAEQLMLDFDSMSPFERTYLQRMIFLYPFLKASTKYPLMFAGERPITSGALMELGAQGQRFAEQEGVLGPRPDLPEWLSGYARGPGGYVNVGSFSPFNMPPEIIQSIMHLRGGKAEPGVQKPMDYANPVWQMALDLLRQQNEYGREATVEEILRSEVPLPAWLAYPLRKPSERWEERDFWNTLLRSLRAAPVGINEGE